MWQHTSEQEIKFTRTSVTYTTYRHVFEERIWLGVAHGTQPTDSQRLFNFPCVFYRHRVGEIGADLIREIPEQIDAARQRLNFLCFHTGGKRKQRAVALFRANGLVRPVLLEGMFTTLPFKELNTLTANVLLGENVFHHC